MRSVVSEHTGPTPRTVQSVEYPRSEEGSEEEKEKESGRKRKILRKKKRS